MNVFKFFKKDCTPCRNLSNMLSRIQLKDINIIDLDLSVTENLEFANKHGINSVPVLMHEDGQKLIGLKSENIVKDFLNGVLKNEISN